jgi:hypothetical protein
MKQVSSLLVASTLAFGSISIAYADSSVTDIESRTASSKVETGAFLKRLGGTLKSEMKAGGPEAAVKVCQEVAPNIANDISLKNGWQVTRVSSKPRNSMMALPDAWEQTALQDFEKRAAKGEKYKDMFKAEVVNEPAGKSFRYMKAIGVAPQCLSCHGSPEQIPQKLQAQFKDLYPHDMATGYKVGDLRGAVSIKQPLNK